MDNVTTTDSLQISMFLCNLNNVRLTQEIFTPGTAGCSRIHKPVLSDRQRESSNPSLHINPS